MSKDVKFEWRMKRYKTHPSGRINFRTVRRMLMDGVRPQLIAMFLDGRMACAVTFAHLTAHPNASALESELIRLNS